MKTLWTLATLFLLSQQIIFAQSNIIGRVIDSSTLQPIELVNIKLMKSDSTFVVGCISGVGGGFELSNIPASDYLLAFSCLGYSDYITAFAKGRDNHNLKDVALKISDVALETVTVTANSVIRKVDRDILIPSSLQIKTSTDGLSLLQNMHLPRLMVDPINKTISAIGGGNVQLRINGVQVELSDLGGLRPEDIIRVEHHQDPGLRYGGAAAVVDFIVKRRESGGNVNANLVQGVSLLGLADDNIAAKVNHKKSEFSFHSYLHFRDLKWKRENLEEYNLPNETLTRMEKGEPTKYKESRLNSRLNYSLVEPDKYFFNAALKYQRNDAPNSFANREGKIYSSTESSPLDMKDFTDMRSDAPSLDLYYQHKLKNEQIIIVNVVGTYIDSENTRVYQESRDEELLTDVYSHIKGDRYSLIGEGIYEKQFANSKLSAGLKHSQSYTNNEYSGTTQAKVNMNNAETYGYTEFQMKVNKFDYTLGVGVSRNYYSQEDRNKEDYTFRPSLRLGYTFNANSYIKLNTYLSSNSPSLSDLNNVAQIMDSLQIRRGNPNLKTSRYLSNTLSAGYKYKFISFDYFMRYVYDKNPVMSETNFEDGKFIQTVNNQKSMQRVHAGINITIRPLKEYITFSVAPNYNYFRSHGNNYIHRHHNWYLRANLTANYKNIVLSAMYSGNNHWLWGEDLAYNETLHTISLGYKRKDWSLMLSTLNPFEKVYIQKNDKLTALTPKKSSVTSKDITPLFMVNFTCNINFGRKFKSEDKRMNHDDWDSGIMTSK